MEEKREKERRRGNRKEKRDERWNHSLVSLILLYFCTSDLIGLFLRIGKS